MQGDTHRVAGPPARASPPGWNGLRVLPVPGRVSREPVSNLIFGKLSGKLRLEFQAVRFDLTVLSKRLRFPAGPFLFPAD